MAAADAVLRRTGRIIGKVLWRNKWALLVLLVALAAALTGVAVYLGGASKVCTSTAAVACTLGAGGGCGVGQPPPTGMHPPKRPPQQLQQQHGVQVVHTLILSTPTSKAC